jgi:cysteine desulfurase / selenocysteine lyase
MLTDAARCGNDRGAMPFDPQSLRPDIPALARRIDGLPLTYLDWAATCLRPARVIDAARHFEETNGATVRRGSHALVDEATELFEASRAAVQRAFGGPDTTVVTTRNATEALNLVAFGWALPRLGPGLSVVTTAAEHHANLIPWQQVTARTGAALRVVVPLEDGTLALDDLVAAIDRTTLVMALSARSNVTGWGPDLPRWIPALRAVAPQAIVVVDACQAALGWALTGLGTVGIGEPDFAAVSAHKMFGPTGVGALIARNDRLEETTPLLFGGEMVQTVTATTATFAPSPARFEAGTPPIAATIGWGAAFDWLDEVAGADPVAALDHLGTLTRHGLDVLTDIPGVTLYGPTRATGRAPVFSFNLAGHHPLDLGARLDGQGFAVRVGTHCAQPLLAHFGTTATVRASASLATTTDEIDALADALRAIGPRG